MLMSVNVNVKSIGVFQQFLSEVSLLHVLCDPL